ncbi:MAG: hypothetical protein U0269_12025 [Polyangiales bacterium]
MTRTLASASLLGLLAACSGNPTPSDDAAALDATSDRAVNDSASMDTSIGADSASMDAVSNVDGGATASDGSADGGPQCPTYQSFCGGRCIPTSVDPNNCGGCGVRCAAAQVCVSNGCTDACPRGLTACSGTCADLHSDNAHCGACGMACAAGTACSAGRCVPSATLDPSGVMCAAGGPPIEIGGFTGGATRCTGDLATVSFRWSICSCRSLQMSAPLLTDGFDSARGPYRPGELGGSVGVNDTFSNSNTSAIGGTLWAGGASGINVPSMQTVRQELHVDGPLRSSNVVQVGGEGWVNGDISTSSTISFGGPLHVPADRTIAPEPSLTYRRLVREPVSVPDPCDCTADRIVPIANIVAWHSTRNDNMAIGLAANHFESDSNPRRVDLPCGRYYFTQIRGSMPVTIVAHGRTAIFIGGNINTSAPITITLDPTATLDIFVAGNVQSSSALRFGSTNYPALTRVYIGGTTGFQVSNTADLGANFYVPNGSVQSSAPLEVFGAVFAGDFQTSNRVSVHYDRQVLRAADDCTPRIPSGSDAGVGDASASDGGGPSCTSCRDCANQACIGGACGMCRTSADCCSPLQCFNGRCVDVPL